MFLGCMKSFGKNLDILGGLRTQIYLELLFLRMVDTRAQTGLLGAETVSGVLGAALIRLARVTILGVEVAGLLPATSLSGAGVHVTLRLPLVTHPHAVRLAGEGVPCVVTTACVPLAVVGGWSVGIPPHVLAGATTKNSSQGT